MMRKEFFFRPSFKSCASAFFPSPFKEAIVLTADGVGESTNCCVGNGRKS